MNEGFDTASVLCSIFKALKFPVMMRLWETHIPIPNMNVKTKTAEGTWRETARENR